MPPDATATAAGTRTPTRTELFTGYLRIGLLGFGGVAAWARRVIDEERRWLTEREYAEVLGLGQVLPGPNVGNAAVMIGRRFGAWAEIEQAVARATAYWNRHKHPFVWGRRRRHRIPRRLGIAAPPNVSLI